jgi:deoxyribodipyrimidine photolyase-like uncharacterized protein
MEELRMLREKTPEQLQAWVEENQVGEIDWEKAEMTAGMLRMAVAAEMGITPFPV